MKVWLSEAAHPDSGGMYRVYQGLYKYLPEYDIEIVNDRRQADVVNAHIGLWGDMPDDLPLVVSSHGMLWKEHAWGKLADKVNRECLDAYRRADVVTAPSHFVARSIARYTGAPARVVHHGVNPDEWLPAVSKGYVLWNKSREDVASDPREMNRLAALAPDVVFYSTFGVEADNVYVTGKVSPDDMKELVSQAGVYLSTAKDSGGPCFGVLEAMSCGIPVLSWDYGGTAEVIEHGITGYLAKPGDYDDLLVGLRECLEHPEWGEAARQKVLDRFTWDKVVVGYVDAYQQAVSGVNETVSVIIPCYNLGRFLPYCLDSVIEQTYTNLEIVVVDDASTDNSWEIIKQYAERDSRIIPIHNSTNQHVSYSRNHGIQRSTGQYILPLDADDRLYPDAVETLVRYLKNHRDYDVVAGKLHIYHETALEGPFQASGWPNNADLKLQLGGYNRLPYSSLYRRKVWERVGGYRTRIRNGTEDADFWTRTLSLGYRAEILDKYTLKYTHRDVSLGKTNTAGSSVWTSWFPWGMEDVPALTTQIDSLDEPLVSVVIPVGPGHLKYLQACIDSLLAQTMYSWEAIAVNDTGTAWNGPPLPGMGFVRFVDSRSNHGVSWARNQGIAAARSNRIVFLDVDDILQPTALQALLIAHDFADGWIYGDWYVYKGEGQPEYSESKDWNYDLILQQSLGPITGIYWKNHVQAVGGFTEDIPGWEDWDFHLKLLHLGVCGTRLRFPLITYNMHLGHRREDNFSNKENLVEYIRSKHYTKLKDKRNMACSACGGKKTLVVKAANASAEGNRIMEDTIQLRYLGSNAGRERITSRTHKGTSYTYSGHNPLLHIFKSDLEQLLAYRLPGGNNPMFVVVEPEPVAAPTALAVEPVMPLVSEEPPAAIVPDATIESLSLEEHVIKKLRKGGFEYISQIREADDAKLLSVKGIGQQRVVEVRKAVSQWTS